MAPPPMLAVGSAGQTLQWVAANADGWVSYPRDPASQRRIVGLWRQALEARAGGEPKPFLQALGVDLLPDPGAPIEPAPYGLRLGRDALARHLAELGALGVSHVILNPARGGRPVAEVAEEIAAEVLPGFAAANTSPPPRFGPIRKG
jgi:alkanesulfonate monooxygenase SsuD/methylene tetrahydromethanopterin reductase-like flavin-dependent oxidoreductase (luciferase family)